MEIVEAGDGVRVERDDDVAVEQAGAARRAVGLDGDHEDAGGLRQVVEARDAAEERDVLAGDAEVAAADAAVAQERGQDGVDGVDRHREAEALAAGDDRGVDADDVAGARRRAVRRSCRG